MQVATPANTLEFLLVSSDPSSVVAVRAALEEAGGRVECPASLDSARELILSRKVDGVIFDTDIKTALEFIARMRQSKNARAFAFVCVKNDAEEAVALKGGATALFYKPLNAKVVSTKISSFRSIILTERRRYQRFDVTLPVVVTLSEITYPGIVENISQGGMAVRLPCLLPEASLVEFSFELQSGTTIEGCAQIKWGGRDGLIGMEFRVLPPRAKEHLMAWLRELAATPLVSD